MRKVYHRKYSLHDVQFNCRAKKKNSDFPCVTMKKCHEMAGITHLAGIKCGSRVTKSWCDEWTFNSQNT